MNKKNVSSKSRTRFYFDDTHKYENFACKKISVDEKSYENILIDDIFQNKLIEFYFQKGR